VVSDIINVSKYALKKYADKNRLQKEAVAYIGQPKQSSSEPNKIFLRLDPLSSRGTVLEFKAEDVVFAENVETVADKDGKTFQIFKVWIRTGSVGVKLEQFVV
jgi:hypothetical protein